MTQLNKEFSKSDVQRMRNLMTGKAAEATKIVSGYKKQEEERKEGDVWEEDGRQWTIKNGIKQNISKLQAARELKKVPLFCPKCNTLMQEKYDAGYYAHFKHCWTCHLKFERDLKLTNKWDDYVKQQNNAEVDALINEYEKWTEEQLNNSGDSFISETGNKETWTKTNNQVFLQQKEEALEFLRGLKK